HAHPRPGPGAHGRRAARAGARTHGHLARGAAAQRAGRARGPPARARRGPGHPPERAVIMRPGRQLLLPANTVFIWFSLIAALALNMLLNMGLFGRAAWVPDLLALTLAFWCVHQPLRIGVGTAFFFGLAMDVHQGALLGQHALSYTA